MPETSTRKVKQRLAREGWVSRGGKEHDVFEHPDRPQVSVVVPRHKTVSIGVARDIEKRAGWKR